MLMIAILVPVFVICALLMAAALFVCCSPNRELRRVAPLSRHRGFHPA